MAKHNNITNHDFVCLCLSLAGRASCIFRSYCETIDHDKILNFKKSIARQEAENNVVADPVGRRRTRSWDCSTEFVLYDDPWKIKKVLTPTDVNNNCNILIKREMARDLIVPILGGRQYCETNDIRVPVWDFDTKSLHSLVFTIRPSNQTHVFKDTWVDDFVLRRNLQVGDEIGMFWDQYNQYFVFSVLRAYRHHQVGDQH